MLNLNTIFDKDTDTEDRDMADTEGMVHSEVTLEFLIHNLKQREEYQRT